MTTPSGRGPLIADRVPKMSDQSRCFKNQHLNREQQEQKRAQKFLFSYREPQHPPSHIVRRGNQEGRVKGYPQKNPTESHQQGRVPRPDPVCAQKQDAGRRAPVERPDAMRCRGWSVSGSGWLYSRRVRVPGRSFFSFSFCLAVSRRFMRGRCDVHFCCCCSGSQLVARCWQS